MLDLDRHFHYVKTKLGAGVSYTETMKCVENDHGGNSAIYDYDDLKMAEIQCLRYKVIHQ